MQTKGGFHTVGRRKTSVARVFLRDGEGHITVNGLPYDQYFDRPTLRLVMNQPLVVAERTTKYDLLINVAGGGKSGQAGAVLQGIARALCEAEPELRKILKPERFLTRDAREVERKKYGRHKARKRPQFSKR